MGSSRAACSSRHCATSWGFYHKQGRRQAQPLAHAPPVGPPCLACAVGPGAPGIQSGAGCRAGFAVTLLPLEAFCKATGCEMLNVPTDPTGSAC
mmetsp:Transcript_41067/g.95475  ORF Transcript_41067/g.95475 Transcript_41067/m.95475 type:complete len:94 (+) Transcript_41067:709-990(+)